MDAPETETTPAPTRSAPTTARLAPLPYHEQVRDYLKGKEPGIWDWFRARRTGQEQAREAEEVRLDLLKTAYRIERETHPTLYGLAEAPAARLGVYSRITFWQSQNAGTRGDSGRNAALAYIPGEAHLVLQGPVTSTLGEARFSRYDACEMTSGLPASFHAAIYGSIRSSVRGRAAYCRGLAVKICITSAPHWAA